VSDYARVSGGRPSHLCGVNARPVVAEAASSLRDRSASESLMKVSEYHRENDIDGNLVKLMGLEHAEWRSCVQYAHCSCIGNPSFSASQSGFKGSRGACEVVRRTWGSRAQVGSLAGSVQCTQGALQQCCAHASCFMV
jgi:hypothetical protein